MSTIAVNDKTATALRFVAIMAIVAFGFFQIKIGRAINDMLESSMNLMNLVVANRDKIKY